MIAVRPAAVACRSSWWRQTQRSFTTVAAFGSSRIRIWPSSSSSRAHQQSITTTTITTNYTYTRRHLATGATSTIPDTNKDENTTQQQQQPLEATYYVPKAERGKCGGRSAFDMDTMVVGETRLARNSRTCPTRELNFLHAQWGKHKSPYRKLRHTASLLYSAPFQRLLFPELFSIATVAAGLTYYNEYIVTCSDTMVSLSMSPSAFAGATTAIGLLAGFRLNSSSGRVKDGRKAWSDVNTATRDLVRQVLMWIPNCEQGVAHKTRMIRLCQAFPVTLMFFVNDKGCHHSMKRKSKPGEAPFDDRVLAEYRAELQDVYHPSKNDYDASGTIQNDFERLCRVKQEGGYPPLEVLTCMSETIATATNNGSQSSNVEQQHVHVILLREIDAQIQRLGLALGASERILKTPLPTGFTRHSSRLLFIWSNCLPLALYPLLGPMGTLPTALLTAYAVLGIEDISVQLEEPFAILPLREYSDSMQSNIAAMEKNFNPPLHVLPSHPTNDNHDAATTATTQQ